jgi:hypothetical protein
MMQYTKPMIDQVFQIRKAAPDHLRAQIKLANPELLDVLADIYRSLQDKLLRELIQQLMSMAGPAWLALLESPAPESRPNHSQQIYRGQVRPAAQVPAAKIAAAPTHHKHVIYRGQLVHS